MVEQRPETLSASAVRLLVAETFADSGNGETPPGDGTRVRRALIWPEGQVDLAPRVRRTAERSTLEVTATRTYAIDAFTRFHDRDFVVAAYRGLLERSPDPAGLEHYLAMLRRGASKTEILGRLRYSGEGKRVGAVVPTLRIRYPLSVLTRLPVIGNVVALIEVLTRANALKGSVKRLEAHVAQLAERQTLDLEAVEVATRRNTAVLEARIDALRGD